MNSPLFYMSITPTLLGIYLNYINYTLLVRELFIFLEI